jgi:hypothetical protein
VVDGGYKDTSGASPLNEMFDSLQPRIDTVNRQTPGSCIVPFFVQLDNDYSSSQTPTASEPPGELRLPLAGLQKAQGGEADAARNAAQRRFTGPIDGDGTAVTWTNGEPVERWARLVPTAHPGASAPLGWVLSETARIDLRDQLKTDSNRAMIAQVRRWLDADGTSLRCARP